MMSMVPVPEVPAGDEAVAQIVRRVWREHIGLPGEWTTARIDQFLAGEADRIESMIDELDQGNESLAEVYRAENGRSPNYLTMLQLVARHQAENRERVLAAELYSQIPEEGLDLASAEEQEQVETRLRHLHRHDPDRWTHPLHRSEPTTEIVELARQLWAGQHVQLRVLAQYLLQARHEDGLALPQQTQDPVWELCTSLLDQALVAKGHADAVYRPLSPRS